jgi:hypothetical protein
MGVGTWFVEHSPIYRAKRVLSTTYYEGFRAGHASLGHELKGYGGDQIFGAGVAAMLLFPGPADEFTLGPTLGWTMKAIGNEGVFYDPGTYDSYSFGMPRIKQSPRQDVTSATSAGQTPKTRGGTKSSRAAKSAPTLKPFWSNGKPKCRKGYRYDFKRKMCVKKS